MLIYMNIILIKKKYGLDIISFMKMKIHSKDQIGKRQCGDEAY